KRPSRPMRWALAAGAAALILSVPTWAERSARRVYQDPDETPAAAPAAPRAATAPRPVAPRATAGPGSASASAPSAAATPGAAFLRGPALAPALAATPGAAAAAL